MLRNILEFMENKMKEFKLNYTKKTFVRWENRKEFVDYIEKINY
jgi:hypothetical protein